MTYPMCMSYEQEREYNDDLMGDGYGANELARSFAYSRSVTPLHGRQGVRAKARTYTANGLCAVVIGTPVYCPLTDGILGTDYFLAFVGPHSACVAYAVALDEECHAEVVARAEQHGEA